mmetsp:Transcript_55798/g.133723  ORF Transcript_55798/g.133723 Transcript_55798/m.133723 type:complete len:127 (-) Transcript_55798:166-546(-)
MKLSACLLALVGAASGLLISPPALPRAGMATRSSAVFMQEDDQTGRGISGSLGGGKKTADLEKNPIAEAGSLAAFVIVFAAITYGGLNPDVVEGFAASNAKCVEGTIVRGEKIKCELVDGIPTRVR